MIIKEFYRKREDGADLYKTYSSENYKIKQIETGIIYDEAIDIEDNNFTYEETDESIENRVVQVLEIHEIETEVIEDGTTEV